MSEDRTTISLDALVPAKVARRAEEVGVHKATLPVFSTLALGVLAGAFIALGAIISTTVATAAGSDLHFGLTRLLSGLIFSLGLILVVLAGAELFTGNNLIVMAWASRRISTRALLRNWLLVYIGNAIGAVATAFLLYLSGQYRFASGEIGATALAIAQHKAQLDFIPALALGALCNALVCLAVWLTLGAHSTTDKILAVIFPITGFVAAGFEHSIANLYFIPIAQFIQNWDQAFVAGLGVNFPNISLTDLLNNLIPVTIGNIIGGAILVAAVYCSSICEVQTNLNRCERPRANRGAQNITG